MIFGPSISTNYMSHYLKCVNKTIIVNITTYLYEKWRVYMFTQGSPQVESRIL
jgi:hypothetical protein